MFESGTATDKSLHSTHSEEQIINDDREGFNEALDHFDIVNGFKSPKNISNLPAGHISEKGHNTIKYCRQG